VAESSALAGSAAFAESTAVAAMRQSTVV
jgi:hypothetical protein